MAGDGWIMKSIEELKAPTNGAIAIGPFGSRMKSDCYVSAGVQVIRGTNISDTRTLIGEMVCITPQLADQLGNAIVHADDLVFPHRGSIGLVGIVPRNNVERYALSSSLMKLTCDRKQVEPLYLFYFFRSDNGRHELLKNASTVGTPGIGQPLSSLRSIKVPLPPLAEQKAIAAVLGALDDKIELNRRMNATLEAMARALFQSWFVNFDPVRAKLDGRQPTNLDPATAALFPEQLEDSPLGHIPRGWIAGKLGDIGTNARRGVQPSEIEPNTPYIALEHMPRRCIALGDWDDSADVASGKSTFKKGEILFGKLRPYFHKVGVAPFDGVCSTDILVLSPKSPEWFGFLLGHAGSDELIQFTDLASTGTKMPRTNWNDISSFKVALPPKPIAAAFTRIIQPMLDRIHAHLHQSRTLATMRDTLLPKLLSGELSVENINPPALSIS
jgi:type I restriction enzyme, S subunit